VTQSTCSDSTCTAVRCVLVRWVCGSLYSIMQLKEDTCVSEREFESGLHFQMQPVVTSVVSFHRTAAITSLTVWPRVSIALHKLNCLQSVLWFRMCLSCHITIYVYSYCHSSKYTLRSGCYSFSLVMATQQQFHVMCCYTLDFGLRCHLGEIISVILKLLFKFSKLLHDIYKHVYTSHCILCKTQKQTKMNVLINHIL